MIDVNTKVNYKKYKCGLHNNEAEYYCLDEKAYNCEVITWKNMQIYIKYMASTSIL